MKQTAVILCLGGIKVHHSYPPLPPTCLSGCPNSRLVPKIYIWMKKGTMKLMCAVSLDKWAHLIQSPEYANRKATCTVPHNGNGNSLLSCTCKGPNYTCRCCGSILPSVQSGISLCFILITIY